MRRLGIDLGTVRTGLAIAESEVPVATPLSTLRHSSLQQAVAAVAGVIASENIAEAVVGLPLRMDGSEGDAARRVRDFAKHLAKQARIPVRLWDERLSTEASLRSLRGQDVRRATKQRVVDQIAAMVILQGFLDRAAGSARSDRDDDDLDDDSAHPATERLS